MNYRKLWNGLFLTILFLQIAYVVSFKTQTLLPFFDLDGESNLPTWVSSILFAGAGFLAIGNYSLRNKNKTFWLILGLCCLFISMDEIAQVHENISILTGIKWIYIYGPIGIIAIIFLTISTYSQWSENSNLRLIMYGIMLGFILSVGLESLSYFGLASLWQKVEYMLEEGAEMWGAGMILIGSLRELMSGTEKLGTKS